MQEVMYIGTLKIARTKWGLFPKNKRCDVEDIEAVEILKIKDFVIPYFIARYIGPEPHRKILHREEIIICPKGFWIKLPILIKYKINVDPQFQVGPDGTSLDVGKILAKQEEKKVVINKPKKKHRIAPMKSPVIKIEKKEEKPKEILPIEIEEMNLPKKLEKILIEAGIKEIPSIKELMKIKGIGAASAKLIKEKSKR